MFYRVRRIEVSGSADGTSRTTQAAIRAESIVEVEQVAIPEYGHEEAVRVVLDDDEVRFCVGTIDTFATPWEPDTAESRFRNAVRMRPDGSIVHISVPDIEAKPDDKSRESLLETAWGIIANAYGGNWDLASEASGWKAAAERWRDAYHGGPPGEGTGQSSNVEASDEPPTYTYGDMDGVPVPDEKVREAVKWLDFHMASYAPQIRTLIDAYCAELREPRALDAEEWHSVDEPPDDGTWCWVTDGKSIWFSRRTSRDQWGVANCGQVVPGLMSVVLQDIVTHWQPANVPELPEGKENNET